MMVRQCSLGSNAAPVPKRFGSARAAMNFPRGLSATRGPCAPTGRGVARHAQCLRGPREDVWATRPGVWCTNKQRSGGMRFLEGQRCKRSRPLRVRPGFGVGLALLDGGGTPAVALLASSAVLRGVNVVHLQRGVGPACPPCPCVARRTSKRHHASRTCESTQF